MSFDDVLVYLLGGLYLGLLFWLCRWYWRRFCRLTKQDVFHYRKTDIWAVIVGLTPTYIVAANAFRGDSVPLFFALLCACTQLAGAFMGRLAIELQPPIGKAGAWDTAIAVAVCAVCSLVLLLVFVAAVAAVQDRLAFLMVVFGALTIFLVRKRK